MYVKALGMMPPSGPYSFSRRVVLYFCHREVSFMYRKQKTPAYCPTYSNSANRKDQSATLVFFGYNAIWLQQLSETQMNDPLRPDERRLINYHRANLAKGGMKDGNNITTFRGMRFGIGDTEDGETLYAPTYFNNRINSDEETIANAKKTGLYARYPTAKAANDAEYKLHEIMSRDTKKYMDAKRPRMSNAMGMKK